MRRLYAVVCRHSGHDTIIRHLVFETETAAQRAAAKRDKQAGALKLGSTFAHRVETVVRNANQTGPSDKYLFERAAKSDSESK